MEKIQKPLQTHFQQTPILCIQFDDQPTSQLNDKTDFYIHKQILEEFEKLGIELTPTLHISCYYYLKAIQLTPIVILKDLDSQKDFIMDTEEYQQQNAIFISYGLNNNILNECYVLSKKQQQEDKKSFSNNKKQNKETMLMRTKRNAMKIFKQFILDNWQEINQQYWVNPYNLTTKYFPIEMSLIVNNYWRCAKLMKTKNLIQYDQLICYNLPTNQ